MTAYRLRPSVEAFVDRHGALCFVRPGAGDLVVRDPEPADLALVERLSRGPVTADELTRPKLEALLEAGLAQERHEGSDPLTGEDAERFDRQLPYLAELGDEHALQRRLRAATVTVIGCGGLGTWTVAALACAGVGRFVLVDDDSVELSNLNRQLLYRREDVGRRKAAATAAWLTAFDPAIEATPLERRILGPEDVPAADAVVLAADQPPYEIGRWVNAACVATRTPFVTAGQLPPIVKVGPTYGPDGACFACHETALRAESAAYDDYVAFRRLTPITASTFGPAAGIAGTLVGTELMHLLVGHRPATYGCTLVLDIRTLEVRRHPLERDPGCSVC